MATTASVPPEMLLPPEVTPAAKFRSSVVRGIASQALPKHLFFMHGDRQGPKRVALTFDDGPDEMTPRYIELLDYFSVRATFFLIGSRAERRPALMRSLVAAGHEVASHGYTHKAFPQMGAAELTDELFHTSEILPPTITPRPFVRPPKGSVTTRSLFGTAAAGFTSVLWSLDSDDCRTVDPKRIADVVSPENVKPGEVVLMHEGQDWTLQALYAIVPALRDAGYELVTVGELMNA
jgi:peptidoglycan/xylan/chitin deacetylase (PgdA/CDA1 family)